MEIHTVIFDLDGTLADTLDDIADCMNHVLAARGLPTHSRDEYRYFVGEGVRRLVEHASPPRARARLDELVEAFRERYRHHFLDRTRPYDGIPELLQELAHRGFTLAVLSNKPHDATERMVRALFPDAELAAVWGHAPPRPRKPDPTVAIELASLLKTPPDRCAFVGDTRTDMRTAVDAGMLPVGVLWGFRDAAELRDNGARILLRHPRELLSAL